MSTTSRRVLLSLLIIGGIINYADRQIIAILKPLIGVDFHWTDAQYGQLASAFQFAAAIGLLFAGWFVDRVGIKWANPIGVGAWSAIATAQGLARTFWEFCVLRVALGAAEASGTPTAVKSVGILFPPDERPLAFGGMNAAGTAGAIVTPLVVPALAAALGWRSAILIVGGSGLAWVAVWVLSIRHSVELGDGTVHAAPGARVPWSSVLRDRRTWAVAGAKVFSDQAWWFLLYWAPDLLHRFYHLNVSQTAVPLAIIYSGAILGSILGALGARRLMRRGVGLDRARKSALLVSALFALPVVLVPEVRSEWVTVFLLGLTLAAHQGFSVSLFSLITDVVPPRQVATVTGIGAFCGNLGGMGILAFTGWILTNQGGYGPVFLFVAVSYLLALLWIHLLLPVLRVAGISDANAVPATGA
jgi:MFS transporter, ACS family, hexuronate transporter